MPRDTSGLKRGGPGRPKGVPNKVTVEIREAARAFVNDEEGQRKLLEQYRRGKLNPAILQMFYGYGWGKPKETLAVEGMEAAPLVIKLTHGD